MSKIKLPNGDDHPEAAGKHLADASALLGAGRADGAAYLSGYVVESALKCIVILERHLSLHMSLDAAGTEARRLRHGLNALSADALRLAALPGARTARYVPRMTPGHSLCDATGGWRETIRYREPGAVTAADAASWVAEAQAVFESTVVTIEQSWRGLRLVLERIGASRVREDRSQLECVLVQAMVPEDVDAAAAAKEGFAERALAEFRDHFYAPDPDDLDENRLWYVRDSEGSDAPHAPVPTSYQPRLAHYGRIDDVADHLAESTELRELGDRIAERFARGSE